jgi:hypothetical protein
MKTLYLAQMVEAVRVDCEQHSGGSVQGAEYGPQGRHEMLKQLAVLVLIGAAVAPVLGQDAKSQISLQVYFVGNSVTDTIKYPALAELAKSRGHNHVWGRHMIPGAPLQWIWEHPKDGDLTMAKNFIDLALPKSPDLQVYVYARWPRTHVNGKPFSWAKGESSSPPNPPPPRNHLT